MDYTRYDAEGQIATQTVQNDASPSTINSFGYDAASQLVSALSTNSGTTTRQIYGYDVAGNRTSVQDGNAITTETPNTVNQLTGRSGGGPLRIRGSLSKAGKVKINGKYAWTAPDNSFEGSVNVTQGLNTLNFQTEDYATPAHVAPYQYQVNVTAATGTGSYTYDYNGNQTGDPTHTYEWDAENRLVKINYIGSNPVQSTTFTYDGLSRRVRISETLGGNTTVQNFLWAGEEIVEQRDAANTVTKRYYPQGFTVGSTNYFYTRDHLGSIREITNASGNILTRYSYGVWGGRTPTYLSGAVDADFGYAGHYEHLTSGLTLTHYRAYSSSTGKWLSRDPIGENGGINLYGYVSNNPINNFDPLGLDWLSDASNFAGGFADAASFGLSKYAREGYLDGLGLSDGPGDDGVDHCSGWYSGGYGTGVGIGLATGGAGLLNGGARSVFYSGEGALAAAQAGKGSGLILADTLGGRALNGIESTVRSLTGKELPRAVWKGASAIFAANAKGTAQAFLRNPSATSI